MSEIWLVDSITVDSPMAFVKKYYIQWLVPLSRIYTIFFTRAVLVQEDFWRNKGKLDWEKIINILVFYVVEHI